MLAALIVSRKKKKSQKTDVPVENRSRERELREHARKRIIGSILTA